MKSLLSTFVRRALPVVLLSTFAAALLPLTVLAKPVDSTYAYVANVFNKLQNHWSTQAINNSIAESNNLLLFTLNEDGSLGASYLDGSPATTEATQAVRAFLSANAPFGPFPESLKGSLLKFKVRVTPDSLQMLSYQIIDTHQEEPTVTYAASTVPQPVSMYYTRALPVTPGRVWEKPETMNTGNSSDASMAEYVQLVQQQVRQNWQLPQDYNFKRTVARLMIDRDGTLLGAQLTQPSGDKLVDKAALNAITTAGKFPKAPNNVPSLPVTIEYVFEPVLQND